jgi:hypothetical protein
LESSDSGAARITNEHSCKVKLVTDKQVHEIELLSEENLAKLVVKAKDIRNVIPVFAVPGYLYEEANVANINHPCAGSACVNFQDQYHSHSYSIDLIAYHDDNLPRSHFHGEPHWNTEIRYMKDNVELGRVPEGVSHTMKDAPSLEIETNCDGGIHHQEVLRDQSVHKKHTILI